jgi:cyclic pyranopterin phosphate synthase
MLPDPMARLSHLDARGRVRMVDVSAKAETRREAVARGSVRMAAATLRLLRAGRTPKGNVLATAHLAAVMAAKRTGEWIPLAHPLRVEAVEVTFTFEPRRPGVAIEATVRSTGRTGVEMEALTAVAAAALTLVDMLKAVDRTLVVEEIALWEKRGGRSGDWRRPAASARPARRATPSARAAGPKAPTRTRSRAARPAARRPAVPRAARRVSRRGR